MTDIFDPFYSERDNVIEAFHTALNLPRRSNKKPYASNHIFDEDQSVKWNREEVERQNAAIEREDRELHDAYYDAVRNAETDIVRYLVKEYSNISEDKIKKIYQLAYRDVFDNNYRMDYTLDYCEEILEIFNSED